MKIGYFGPAGTFTEQAARHYKPEGEFTPYRTIQDVLEAVECSIEDVGIVPMENTTDGIVNQSIDWLAFDGNLFIQKEIILPIRQFLMTNKKGGKITKILSHEKALAQCGIYIRKAYPEAETIAVSSTAEAARIVVDSGEGVAMVGGSILSGMYGLEIIGKNIQDFSENYTSFVAVGKNNTTEPADNMKTTLAFSTQNKPGELYRLLDIFSLWNINMTRIFSRPMKNKPGEYIFLVDIEGYDVKDAIDSLTMIRRKTTFYKVLGSYEVIKI